MSYWWAKSESSATRLCISSKCGRYTLSSEVIANAPRLIFMQSDGRPSSLHGFKARSLMMGLNCATLVSCLSCLEKSRLEQSAKATSKPYRTRFAKRTKKHRHNHGDVFLCLKYVLQHKTDGFFDFYFVFS